MQLVCIGYQRLSGKLEFVENRCRVDEIGGVENRKKREKVSHLSIDKSRNLKSSKSTTD